MLKLFQLWALRAISVSFCVPLKCLFLPFFLHFCINALLVWGLFGLLTLLHLLLQALYSHIISSPALDLEQAFLQEARVLLLGNSVRNQDLGSQCAHCCWSAISLSLSRADRARKYMFVHQPMYLCTHIVTNISVCNHLYLY